MAKLSWSSRTPRDVRGVARVELGSSGIGRSSPSGKGAVKLSFVLAPSRWQARQFDVLKQFEAKRVASGTALSAGEGQRDRPA